MVKNTFEINVKIPRKYHKKKYIEAFALGLYNLICGKQVPEDVDYGDKDDLVSVRIKLSSKGMEFWNYFLSKEYEGNKRKLAREVLYLLSQEPEHYLQCRI